MTSAILKLSIDYLIIDFLINLLLESGTKLSPSEKLTSPKEVTPYTYSGCLFVCLFFAVRDCADHAHFKNAL